MELNRVQYGSRSVTVQVIIKIKQPRDESSILSIIIEQMIQQEVMLPTMIFLQQISKKERYTFWWRRTLRP